MQTESTHTDRLSPSEMASIIDENVSRLGFAYRSSFIRELSSELMSRIDDHSGSEHKDSSEKGEYDDGLLISRAISSAESVQNNGGRSVADPEILKLYSVKEYYSSWGSITDKQRKMVMAISWKMKSWEKQNL